jgi:hypothetical protein
MIISDELAALSPAALCASGGSGDVRACQVKGRFTGKPSGIVTSPISGHTLMRTGLLTHQRGTECRH